MDSWPTIYNLQSAICWAVPSPVIQVQLDWPDRTIGLGPDWTGLICKQSGPKFWDQTVVRSHGPVQSKLSNGPVYIFWTGLYFEHNLHNVDVIVMTNRNIRILASYHL